MKKSITLFCLVVFIGKAWFVSLGIAAELGEECKHVGFKTSVVRLKDYLFCNYPWNENHTKTNLTVVGIEILPTFATMNEYENHLELGTWMHVTWIDQHLAWDPAQFDNVQRLDVYTSNIWAPAISVQSLDAEQADEDLLMLGRRCNVNHKGEVLCLPRQRHTIACENDFTSWPYDRHNCTLVLTSWPQMPNEIMFAPMDIFNQTVFTHDFVINGHWEISISRITYEQIRSKHLPKSSKLAVDFIVDRVHPQLAGRYVLPAMLVTIMTLTTVSLNPGSMERLALGCLNPIIHLLSIEDLNCILPQNANTMPNIVLIYVNSFVLAIVALLLTIFLTNLRSSGHSVPKWIFSTLSLVLRYRIGRIALLGIRDRGGCSSIEEHQADHDDDLVDLEHVKSNWNYVVLLLNWIIFLSFLLTYIVLWTIFVPNSSMKSPILDNFIKSSSRDLGPTTFLVSGVTVPVKAFQGAAHGYFVPANPKA